MWCKPKEISSQTKGASTTAKDNKKKGGGNKKRLYNNINYTRVGFNNNERTNEAKEENESDKNRVEL